MAGEIILERRARSNRNAERDHRGFASDFPRHPQHALLALDVPPEAQESGAVAGAYSRAMLSQPAARRQAAAGGDVAFVPLAMPLIFGPGAIATVLGTASLVRHPLAQILSLSAITLAILATMGTTYLILAYADIILGRVGPRGIDAATRIVGFFVAAMGVGLIFHGVTEAIHTYGLAATH
jgi:hypothetical protein